MRLPVLRIVVRYNKKDGLWDVKRSGRYAPTVLAIGDSSKVHAVAWALKLAKDYRPSRVIINKKNGEIEHDRSYH